jgi:hypothetical protein
MLGFQGGLSIPLVKDKVEAATRNRQVPVSSRAGVGGSTQLHFTLFLGGKDHRGTLSLGKELLINSRQSMDRLQWLLIQFLIKHSILNLLQGMSLRSNFDSDFLLR